MEPSESRRIPSVLSRAALRAWELDPIRVVWITIPDELNLVFFGIGGPGGFDGQAAWTGPASPIDWTLASVDLGSPWEAISLVRESRVARTDAAERDADDAWRVAIPEPGTGLLLALGLFALAAPSSSSRFRC